MKLVGLRIAARNARRRPPHPRRGDWQLERRNTSLTPARIATHPGRPGILHLITFDGRYLRSHDRGKTWVINSPGGFIRPGGMVISQLFVDARPKFANVWCVYVVEHRGSVWVAPFGGSFLPWRPPGVDVQVEHARAASRGDALRLCVATTSQDQMAQGKRRRDMWALVTDPGQLPAWANLTERDSTTRLPWFNRDYRPIPAPAQPNWDRCIVDYCPGTDRYYALFYLVDAPSRRFHALYTIQGDPRGQWEARFKDDEFIVNDLPPNDRDKTLPSEAEYPALLRVVPTDETVLLLTGVGSWRSEDGGKSWYSRTGTTEYHVDIRALEFEQVLGKAGVPRTFIGTDGGLGVSTALADRWIGAGTGGGPTEETIHDSHRNEGVQWSSHNPHIQNWNHGLSASNLTGYSCDPSLPGLSYISTWHTGFQSNSGSRVWFYKGPSEGLSIAAARGANGMVFWHDDFNVTLHWTVEKDPRGLAGATQVKGGPGKHREFTVISPLVAREGRCFLGTQVQVRIPIKAVVGGKGRGATIGVQLRDDRREEIDDIEPPVLAEIREIAGNVDTLVARMIVVKVEKEAATAYGTPTNDIQIQNYKNLHLRPLGARSE